MADMIAGAVGRCSVPMWRNGAPDGFCDRPAYGQQYNGTRTPPRFSNRDANTRRPYAPRLCCEAHGGPGENDIRFMRDGNMWCAFMLGFENLQESVAGFGPTQDAAEANLRASDSGSRSQSRDPSSGARAGGRQSGGEAASPDSDRPSRPDTLGG